MLPVSSASCSAAWTALQRLSTFLNLPETHIQPSSPSANPSILMREATFRWGLSDLSPVLHNISLDVKAGQMVAITGPIGSGKSSLLLAILKEVALSSGVLEVSGSISYASQEPWLVSESVRENILFGLPMRAERYCEVLRVCGLESDIKMLADGDNTIVGERGAGLSGGQRQRVSLARAVYRDSNIYLLDDPLSAVDQRVALHIFQQCFKGFLRDKIVLFVTHQLQYLSSCDLVIVMEHGRVVSNCSFKMLANDRDSPLFAMLRQHDEIEEEKDEITIEEVIVEAPSESLPSDGRLIEACPTNFDLFFLSDPPIDPTADIPPQATVFQWPHEARTMTCTQGPPRHHELYNEITYNSLTLYGTSDVNVHLHKVVGISGSMPPQQLRKPSNMAVTYREYLSAGVGLQLTCLVMCFIVIVHSARLTGDWWLKEYTSNGLNLSSTDYLSIYAVLTVLFSTLVLLRGIAWIHVSLSKSRMFFQELLKSISHAPMAFFDMVPLGSILAVFSRYLAHLDDLLSDQIFQALMYFPMSIGAMLLPSIYVPYSFSIALGLLCMVFLLTWFVQPAEQILKQMEAASKPCIFSHLSTSLEGVFSLRAYQAQERFENINLQNIDKNNRSLYSLTMVKAFLAFYIDCFTAVYIFLCGMLIIVEQVSPSNTGLALSNALQVMIFLQWTVRFASDTHTNMASVQQISFYARKVNPEAPWIMEKRPPPHWPAKGAIEFRNVWLRYQIFAPPVLRGVSFSIRAGEKIGIVGRTGSGKSSLLYCIMRMAEAFKGTVVIDDLNVASIGLHDLRRKVAIIPQEPVMFTGTLRSNLDPSNERSDAELWAILRMVRMENKVKSFPDTLLTPIDDNGARFSVGQRQLFNVARAVLSDCSIVLLDEATAAVDTQTDAIIQDVFRSCFASRTVLTIAHRLSTIIDYDRILVMHQGRCVEFDTAAALLARRDSIFSALVDQTGEESSSRLRGLASVAANARSTKLGALYPLPETCDVRSDSEPTVASNGPRALPRASSSASSSAIPVDTSLDAQGRLLSSAFVSSSSLASSASPSPLLQLFLPPS